MGGIFIFCKSCGQEVVDKQNKFCLNCGQELGKDQQIDKNDLNNTRDNNQTRRSLPHKKQGGPLKLILGI